MSRVITYFMISAMMLAMPSFIGVAGFGDLGAAPHNDPNNISQLAQNIQSQFLPFVNALSYIMGIMFGLRGVLALKEYAEYGDGPRTSYTENTSEKKVEATPAVINLEKDLKTEAVTIVKDIFKKEKLYDYDFEDKELNDLGLKIQSKVKYLSGHNFLQKDMECLLMVENTEKEYLKSIHQTYIEIPFAKRGNIKMENSPYSLAHRQLNLVLETLDEIENKIVNHNVMNQRANEIFLKEKLANM